MKIVIICLLLMISIVAVQLSRDEEAEDLQNLLTGPRTNTRKRNKVRTLNIKKVPLRNTGRGGRPTRLDPRKPRVRPVQPVQKRRPAKIPTQTKYGKEVGKSKMDVSQKLRGAKKLEDVLKMFPPKGITLTPVQGGGISNPKENRKYMFAKRPKKEGQQREVQEVMEFAVQGECKPTLQCEDLSYLSHKHNGHIWPASVTYLKCGGCCLDHEEPVVVEYEEPTRVNVVVIPYDEAECEIKEHMYKEHKSCACVCKVKEEHCKPSQTYDPENCRCNCEERARKECGANKQWSNTDCGCTCKYPDTVCSKNKIFDKKECKCQCRKRSSCRGFTKWNEHTCTCLHSFNSMSSSRWM